MDGLTDLRTDGWTNKVALKKMDWLKTTYDSKKDLMEFGFHQSQKIDG